MKVNETYAVVDLETTGTALNGKERIIQFSCVFIKNNKISKTFNTYVNPQMKIPTEVQKLTGITDKDVRKAPLFEDVAGTIYALLQDTIFVAHNIEFDYRFLNLALEQAGYPELDLVGIDTVQLAKIVLPTLPTYRLTNLGEYLNIKNENPHRADSDAKVTAEIFLLLLEKIKEFPLPLLQMLSQMGNNLLYDTGRCFRKAFHKKEKQSATLPADLVVVDDLVLQRLSNQEPAPSKQPQPYLYDLAAKAELFQSELEIRKNQVMLMDDIAEFFEQEITEKIILEAPTGIGKTLGYLLPLAYLTTKGKKFVISTATTALQQQLLEKDFVQLQKLLPFSVQAVSAQGSQNYLDLAKFRASLRLPHNKNTRLLQMRILVWLTQTTTGLFSELNLTTLQEPLFKEVAHKGPQSIQKGDVFYEYDFVRRQEQQIKQADLIVTNHAYLLRHADQLSLEASELVVDEAHNLAQVANLHNRQVLDFDQIKIISDTILVKMESQINYSFAQLVDLGFLTEAQLQQLLKNLRVINRLVPDLRLKFQERFMQKQMKFQGDEYLEVILDKNKYYGFLKNNWMTISKVQKALAKTKALKHEMELKYIQVRGQGFFDHQAVLLLADYFKLIERLNRALKGWQQFDLENLEEQEQVMLWLSLSAQRENAHLKLQSAVLEGQDYLAPELYNYFNHTLLIGASLFLPQTKEYLLKQLDLPLNTKIKKYPSSFNYQKQALGLVVTDAPNIGEMNEEDYYQEMAEILSDIVKHNPVQTLILFNSLDAIRKVYSYMMQTNDFSRQEILAQGVTGSVEKLKKRFLLGTNKHKVLLGTGSFWEGVDLPGDALELLIVVKLPFQAPNTSYNRVRYQKVTNQGESAFYKIALPEAIIRLKQGWGRLLRNNQDSGAFILLDPRYCAKNYGKYFKAAFPNEFKLQKVQKEQVNRKLKAFQKKLAATKEA
ncbi:helicase C-terminal domain-containing protein [Ligilactobacillus ceti]|uniref:3'-5' exonuclease DinG n=1 Tax=Ligilactobacillus ceti DSM 22408 TaxID=1122146 RepID=A0A0R2KRC6_9LACO|nr:helicase C-terminal domain-containing protein [Ligilactobacillus ceti]KRN88660.1 ATP-dependent helicase DinG [Ligilactobacillus ceti DSM 22408]